MNRQPQVSVIIPTYNNAAYIEHTVNSVLDQDFTDYELIVVDDGSIDNTQKVLHAYRDRIQVVSQTNSGVSAARNHGLSLAKGEYILFLDSDDLLLPGKLTAQVTMLDQQPVLAYVHSSWQNIDQDGILIDTAEPWHKAPDLSLENWLMFKPIFMGAMLFRRDWVDQVGGFDPTLPQGEDLKFIFQIVLSGAQGTWLYQPTVCYRQHSASLTNKEQVQMLDCANRVVAEFFAQPNLAPDVLDMKDEVGFGTLLWSAWQMYLAGNEAGIAKFLSQSKAYDHSRDRDELLKRWLRGFYYQSLHDGRELKEVHALFPHMRAAAEVNEVDWVEIEPALARWLKIFAVLEANY